MSNQYSTDEQKVSYGIGRQTGAQILENAFAGMDAEAIIDGVADLLRGRESGIDDDAMRAAFQAVTARMQAGDAEKGRDRAEAGAAFLAENAGREGVQLSDSGLQYEVLVSGDGPVPSATSTVRAHYHGSLIDGTVFDSSYERGEPLDIAVGGVIAGWTEALQMMPVGSKWRLFLPHELAYGAQGAGSVIGPCETLVFDVELLAIIA